MAKRRQRLLQVIADRAKFEAELAEKDGIPIPGAATGLVVSVMKRVGAMLVKTHAVDIKLLTELRMIEQQLAEELGQWPERQVNTEPILTPDDIPDHVLDELIEKARRQRQELIARPTRSLRAARNSFTGTETSPKVRWPLQTIDGIPNAMILKTCWR